MTPIYDLVCKCTETQEKELLDAQERIDYQFELITSRVLSFVFCNTYSASTVIVTPPTFSMLGTTQLILLLGATLLPLMSLL